MKTLLAQALTALVIVVCSVVAAKLDAFVLSLVGRTSEFWDAFWCNFAFILGILLIWGVRTPRERCTHEIGGCTFCKSRMDANELCGDVYAGLATYCVFSVLRGRAMEKDGFLFAAVLMFCVAALRWILGFSWLKFSDESQPTSG